MLASAADEPDYGHDINLFSDNPGAVGAVYGFGPQPFGDARFQYSSQAPFHMGFFHESAVVYAAAGFLERSWPDWRAYQYMGLARLAFASGHPYWGYRFLGWGLHHVQDLTQPYHAKPLPGVDLASLLLLEGKAIAGFADDKQASIERVATRHMEVEKYQSTWLRRLLRAGQPHPMLAAYADVAQDKQLSAVLGGLPARSGQCRVGRGLRSVRRSHRPVAGDGARRPAISAAAISCSAKISTIRHSISSCSNCSAISARTAGFTSVRDWHRSHRGHDKKQ